MNCNPHRPFCCLQHNPECMACGERATKLPLRGKRVGPYCTTCYRELTTGEVPNVIGPRSQSMGSRARLRYLQNQAFAKRVL